MKIHRLSIRLKWCLCVLPWGSFHYNNKEKRARPQACKEFQIIVISWGKLVSLSHPFSVMRTVSSILMPPTPGM